MVDSTMTNKLNVKINYNKLLERYYIYKIQNSSKNAKEYQSFYASIRDNIKPLAHATDGKYTLIVLAKGGLAKEYANKYEMTELHFAEIQKEKEYILLRLLNSLLAKESGYFEVENDPYGLYYLVDAKSSILLAINISIDKEMFLSLNVTTFTKTKNLKDAYRIHENKLVKALEKQDEKQLYKKGNYNSRKSSYRFLGLMKNSNRDLIQNSKVYVLIQYLKEIQRCFKEIIEINLSTMSIKLYDSGSDEKARKEELQEQIKLAIGSQSVHIANYTDSDLTKEIEDLKRHIENYIGDSLQISSSDKVQNSAYNLTITHDEDYYKKNKLDDPYIAIHKDENAIVQNFTVDVLKKAIKSTSILQALLKELVIKKEIMDKKLILPYHQFSDKITVIYPYKTKDKRYEFYKVITDGRDIYFVELSDMEHHICSEIAFYAGNRDLEVIIFSGEDIGYIVKTKEFPLPKIQEIQQLIEEYNKPKYLHYKKVLEIWDSIYKNEKKNLRERLLEELGKIKHPISGEVLLTALRLGKDNNKFKIELEKLSNKKLVVSLKGKKENRHCIESLIGIRYSDIKFKYYVGRLDNVSESIEKSSPIREVCTYRGKNILNMILPMLNEYFVKNGDFTVLPYPIKYIKEYYRENIQ
ncbi:hypothetical protein [Sulfurimonas sp.]